MTEHLIPSPAFNPTLPCLPLREQDCGGDAHAHVMGCPDNPRRDFFCDEQTFNRVQNTRRKRNLRAYFDTLPDEHRRETLEDVTPELRDLGPLDPAEFQP